MKVDINAGHSDLEKYRRGFKAVGSLDECHEGINNFKIFELIRAGLKEYEDVTVTTSRPKIGDDPTLAARGLSGAGADLQIQLHSNAGGGRGPEVILRPDATDNIVALAKEIREAIRGLADLPFRALKFPIADGNGGIVWKTERGPGVSYYGELRHSPIRDTMLLEMAFHDNDNEAKFLRTKRQEIADAIVKTIADHYGLQKRKPVQDPKNGPYVNAAGERLWFRVMAGSYKTRAEAEAALKDLETKGYNDSWLMAAYVKEK